MQKVTEVMFQVDDLLSEQIKCRTKTLFKVEGWRVQREYLWEHADKEKPNDKTNANLEIY